MSDEQSPNPNMEGQAEAAPWSQGQAEPAPASPGGQAEAPLQSQDQGQAPEGTPATDEPTFFDPQNLSPELMVAYKQMQAAFTTKTQDIARQRQKIEAYDQFMRDPVNQIQQIASQYGLQLTRAQAQQVQDQQQQAQNWEPQTWDDVLKRAEEAAEARIMQRLQPFFEQQQRQQATTIENQLKSIDPNWQQYEGNMRDLLQSHPSLVNDVSALYRLAVPPEALEAKAIQQALRKFEEKGKHAAVTSGKSAPRSSPQSPKVKSFDEAYQDARRKVLSGEV